MDFGPEFVIQTGALGLLGFFMSRLHTALENISRILGRIEGRIMTEMEKNHGEEGS